MKFNHPILFLLVASSLQAADNRLPPASCNLRSQAPVTNWFDAVPLGNGELGALVWGQGNQLTVKIDRLDIWDERFDPGAGRDKYNYRNLQKSVQSHRASHEPRVPLEKAKGYDRPPFFGSYDSGPPTHVAIGKLLITMPKGVEATLFTLDLATAQGGVQFSDGRMATAIVAATAPVILLRIPGRADGLKLWAPGKDPKWFAALGYPEPVFGGDDAALWYEQAIPAGTDHAYSGTGRVPAWKFVVYAKRKAMGDDTVIAITVASSRKDGTDPLAAARAYADRALAAGYASLSAAHRRHWAEFWEHSSVGVPNAAILNQYYQTRYFLRSSSSPGFPALATLQSIWTDHGMIPAFRNNLHGDLNTQGQYQSYQTSGDFAEGRAFLDYLWDLLPVLRGYARTFYGTAGAAVPTCMSLGGNPTGGWPQYWASPTYAGWYGWLFYQHWRYTRDREFLAARAYPWCAEIAECWSGLLKTDDKGILKLPLSSSSEIFDDSLRAWLAPNSNQDRDFMEVHLLGLAEMADVLGKTEQAKRWRSMAGKLGPRHVDEENALMWNETERVTQSHRHFSHSMGVWPFNTVTIEGTGHDRQIIAATMRKFDQHGDMAWCGFSWPWMSSLRSRIGDAESAYKYLDLFVAGFLSRNGFNMSNDIHGATRKPMKSDYMEMTANMMANQATHDMLLQSWAPSLGRGEAGIVRLFPATPWLWHDASFADLRAEGGFRVSAGRKRNATVWFRITADADGLLRLRNNFGGRSLKWVGTAMDAAGENFEKSMRQGDVVEATLETPKGLPPRPVNAYFPIARPE
jgi:alpha-L-fucosidase 2